MSEGGAELIGNQPPHASGLAVVGVVVATAQGVGANHDPALDFTPEAAFTGPGHAAQDVAARFPGAVDHAVVAGQVAAGLGHGNQVIGRDGVLQGRQADLAYARACAAQGVQSGGQDSADPHRVAAQTFRDHAHPQAAQGFRGPGSEGRRRVHAGGVARVMSRDDIHDQRQIGGVAGQGANLIQAAGMGHQTVAADPPVGGFQAIDAAQRRRLPDRAPRIAAQADGGQARGHHRRAAAAGPAGDPRPVPGIQSRAVSAALAGAAHCKFVHVGLAHHHRARREEALHGGGGVGTDVVFQHPASASGARARQVEVVLDDDR